MKKEECNQERGEPHESPPTRGPRQRRDGFQRGKISTRAKEKAGERDGPYIVLVGLSTDFRFLDSIRGASHGKAFLKQSGVFLRPATTCSYEGLERSALL